MNGTPEVEAVYTSDEAAAILQVDRRTISNLVRRGALRVLPHLRHHRIPASSIAAYMATATAKPAPPRPVEPVPAVRPADAARAAIAAARAANKADAWRQEVLGFLDAHPGKEVLPQRAAPRDHVTAARRPARAPGPARSLGQGRDDRR